MSVTPELNAEGLVHQVKMMKYITMLNKIAGRELYSLSVDVDKNGEDNSRIIRVSEKYPLEEDDVSLTIKRSKEWKDKSPQLRVIGASGIWDANEDGRTKRPFDNLTNKELTTLHKKCDELMVECDRIKSRNIRQAEEKELDSKKALELDTFEHPELELKRYYESSKEFVLKYKNKPHDEFTYQIIVKPINGGKLTCDEINTKKDLTMKDICDI